MRYAICVSGWPSPNLYSNSGASFANLLMLPLRPQRAFYTSRSGGSGFEPDERLGCDGRQLGKIHVREPIEAIYTQEYRDQIVPDVHQKRFGGVVCIRSQPGRLDIL